MSCQSNWSGQGTINNYDSLCLKSDKNALSCRRSISIHTAIADAIRTSNCASDVVLVPDDNEYPVYQQQSERRQQQSQFDRDSKPRRRRHPTRRSKQSNRNNSHNNTHKKMQDKRDSKSVGSNDDDNSRNHNSQTTSTSTFTTTPEEKSTDSQIDVKVRSSSSLSILDILHGSRPSAGAKYAPSATIVFENLGWTSWVRQSPYLWTNDRYESVQVKSEDFVTRLYIGFNNHWRSVKTVDELAQSNPELKLMQLMEHQEQRQDTEFDVELVSAPAATHAIKQPSHRANRGTFYYVDMLGHELSPRCQCRIEQQTDMADNNQVGTEVRSQTTTTNNKPTSGILYKICYNSSDSTVTIQLGENNLDHHHQAKQTKKTTSVVLQCERRGGPAHSLSYQDLHTSDLRCISVQRLIVDQHHHQQVHSTQPVLKPTPLDDGGHSSEWKGAFYEETVVQFERYQPDRLRLNTDCFPSLLEWLLESELYSDQARLSAVVLHEENTRQQPLRVVFVLVRQSGCWRVQELAYTPTLDFVSTEMLVRHVQARVQQRVDDRSDILYVSRSAKKHDTSSNDLRTQQRLLKTSLRATRVFTHQTHHKSRDFYQKAIEAHINSENRRWASGMLEDRLVLSSHTGVVDVQKMVVY